MKRINRSIRYLFILSILLFAQQIFGSDLHPLRFFRPRLIEPLNKPFKVGFTVGNQNVVDAFAAEWHSTIKIVDPSSNTVFTDDVPGVFLGQRPGGDGTETTVDSML